MGITGDIYKGFTIGKEGTPGRISSKSYGVYLTGEGVYDSPQRDVEMISIPGRNGQLVRDNGRWENITLTYRAGIYAATQEEFAETVRAFRDRIEFSEINNISGGRPYLYIYDDYNTDEFRLGIFKGGFEVSPVAYGQAGEFDIVFDCKPQRFLKSGETDVAIASSGRDITNPTGFKALPLIKFRLTGTGENSITFTSSNVEMGKITTNGAPLNTDIYVDCEVGEAYYFVSGNRVSVNEYVSIGASLPSLIGNTTITYTSNVSNVRITPRWWRI